MEKLKYSETINASKEKVWETLWSQETYGKWTSAFIEGSHAVTDNWKEGSKVLFLGPDKSGMVSEVAANKPYQFMSFRHLGEVKNGVEDTESERVKAWAGSHENYSLTENNGVTTLDIEMDSNEEMKDYFTKTWPVAIEQLKQLAEANA